MPSSSRNFLQHSQALLALGIASTAESIEETGTTGRRIHELSDNYGRRPSGKIGTEGIQTVRLSLCTMLSFLMSWNNDVKLPFQSFGGGTKYN